MGFHELFFGFAGESNNDVCRDGATRDPGADVFHEVTVLLLSVATLHVEKHLVIACLDGDLDMGHHLWEFGNGIHQIFAEIIRMRCEEADTLDAFHLMDHAQQAREVRTIGYILAITVNDLTEERHLPDALRGKRTDLGNNIAYGTAALNAAPEGDDAKGAGMRTAIHHWDMRTDKIAALMLR